MRFKLTMLVLCAFFVSGSQSLAADGFVPLFDITFPLPSPRMIASALGNHEGICTVVSVTEVLASSGVVSCTLYSRREACHR